MNITIETKVIIYTEIKETLTLESLKDVVPERHLHLNDYDMFAVLEEQNKEPVFMGFEGEFLVALSKKDFNWTLCNNMDGTITHRLYREVDNITFLTILQYAFDFAPSKEEP